MPSSVINLGCRANIYEGEVINNILKKNNADDVIVINTCAVTQEAQRKSRQMVRKMKKLNPNKKIIVTGCASQINPDQYQNMTEVDSIINNEKKTMQSEYENWFKIDDLSENHNPEVSINSSLAMFENRTRAIVQIQNGCDHNCTFCIIPYGRGRSRSIPAGQVIQEIKALVNNGFEEIVLSGIDLTSYGHDLPHKLSLGNICKRIITLVPNLKRLRLSSVDVAEIDQEIYELLQTSSVMMPYFHISLQSGDNTILKRMKRRHTREDAIIFCEKVRKIRPDAGFGADIIAGFPTETEEMFENTRNLLKECEIAYNHIFTFSPHPKVFASSMKDQIPHHIKKERTNILINDTEEIFYNFAKKFVGTQQKILMESDTMGRMENFLPVEIG